jgi:hypothetical protein
MKEKSVGEKQFNKDKKVSKKLVKKLLRKIVAGELRLIIVFLIF